MTAPDLRATLSRLGLSPAEAASLVGVHPVTMRKWIAEMQPIPPPAARLLTLVDVLGLRPAFVMEKLGLHSSEP